MQFALKTVQQLVEHKTLAVVQRCGGMRFPETSFLQNAAECFFRAVKGTIKATEKPLQPWGNIEAAFLRLLEHFVIGFSLRPDLRGHTVETLRALFRTGQRHISDRARNAPVAIVKRMNRDKPQMSKPRPQDRIGLICSIEPF